MSPNSPKLEVYGSQGLPHSCLSLSFLFRLGHRFWGQPRGAQVGLSTAGMTAVQAMGRWVHRPSERMGWNFVWFMMLHAFCVWHILRAKQTWCIYIYIMIFWGMTHFQAKPSKIASIPTLDTPKKWRRWWYWMRGLATHGFQVGLKGSCSVDRPAKPQAVKFYPEDQAIGSGVSSPVGILWESQEKIFRKTLGKWWKRLEIAWVFAQKMNVSWESDSIGSSGFAMMIRGSVY